MKVVQETTLVVQQAIFWPIFYMKYPDKRFIVRKYIMAKSASEALRKELKIKADEVWIDPDWIKDRDIQGVPIKGFE